MNDPTTAETPDLRTVEGVKAYMSAASSKEEWDERVAEVRAANGGKRPAFWHRTIMNSGLAYEVSGTWSA